MGFRNPQFDPVLADLDRHLAEEACQDALDAAHDQAVADLKAHVLTNPKLLEEAYSDALCCHPKAIAFADLSFQALHSLYTGQPQTTAAVVTQMFDEIAQWHAHNNA